MRIGYSFWGFLGPGITDTPDGGRSHRATLIDGLTTAGHDNVLLQPNRDLLPGAPGFLVEVLDPAPRHRQPIAGAERLGHDAAQP